MLAIAGAFPVCCPTRAFAAGPRPWANPRRPGYAARYALGDGHAHGKTHRGGNRHGNGDPGAGFAPPGGPSPARCRALRAGRCGGQSADARGPRKLHHSRYRRKPRAGAGRWRKTARFPRLKPRLYARYGGVRQFKAPGNPARPWLGTLRVRCAGRRGGLCHQRPGRLSERGGPRLVHWRARLLR